LKGLGNTEIRIVVSTPKSTESFCEVVSSDVPTSRSALSGGVSASITIPSGSLYRMISINQVKSMTTHATGMEIMHHSVNSTLCSNCFKIDNVMRFKGLEIGNHMDPMFAAKPMPRISRFAMTGEQVEEAASGLIAANIKTEPEKSTEDRTMVPIMRLNRKHAESTDPTTATSFLTKRLSNSHFETTLDITRAPKTRNEILLKTFPINTVEVFIMFICLPKTAQMVPRTGIKRAVQYNGIT